MLTSVPKINFQHIQHISDIILVFQRIFTDFSAHTRSNIDPGKYCNHFTCTQVKVGSIRWYWREPGAPVVPVYLVLVAGSSSEPIDCVLGRGYWANAGTGFWAHTCGEVGSGESWWRDSERQRSLVLVTVDYHHISAWKMRKIWSFRLVIWYFLPPFW